MKHSPKYYIENGDGDIFGFEYTLNGARVYASEVLRNRGMKWIYIRIRGAKEPFLTITSHRSDRWDRWGNHHPGTAYYAEEDITPRGEWGELRYYQFSPKTGKIVYSDDSIKQFFW